MGGGNLTYRQDVWRGGKPAYLARASALQLASHPLITGSDRGRWDDVGRGFEALQFSATNRTLQIRGAVGGAVPPYAVVAYVWPEKSRGDHLALTYPAVVRDGTFALEIEGLRPDSYRLKLASLHVNGGPATLTYRFGFDAAGQPEADALNAAWKDARAKGSQPGRKR